MVNTEEKNIGQKLFSAELNLADPSVRKYIVERGGLLGWCLVYLRHYLTVEPADFHYVLSLALESELPEDELIEIIGFRGSAKSTFAVLALPLYAALEAKQNFIVVAGDTTTQTKMNIENIRYELESNAYIIEDYGISFDSSRNWSTEKLQLANGVLIMGRSRGQKMRGLRHRQYRPQIVIVDDAEDLIWVKEKKNRDKTERWFNGEVIPAQQEDKSKLILIGNLLHKDALMMRVKKSKKPDGTRLFKVLEFPLVDPVTKHVMWTGKYPTKEALNRQKAKVRSRVVWLREYLLKIVSEEDQIIKEEDIAKYPVSILTDIQSDGKKRLKIKDGLTAVDLAISLKETADNTAVVSGLKADYFGKERILIKPNPINKRMDFATSQKVIKNQHATMPLGSKVVVEDVAYQKAAIQELERKGIPVKGIRPITDKRARLETVAPYIKDGTVMFAEVGNEELVDQLLDFGVEAKDDLVDALVYLILDFIGKKQGKVGVGKIDSL